MEYCDVDLFVESLKFKLIEGAIMTYETIDSAQAAWILSREPLK